MTLTYWMDGGDHTDYEQVRPGYTFHFSSAITAFLLVDPDDSKGLSMDPTGWGAFITFL